MLREVAGVSVGACVRHPGWCRRRSTRWVNVDGTAANFVSSMLAGPSHVSSIALRSRVRAKLAQQAHFDTVLYARRYAGAAVGTLRRMRPIATAPPSAPRSPSNASPLWLPRGIYIMTQTMIEQRRTGPRCAHHRRAQAADRGGTMLYGITCRNACARLASYGQKGSCACMSSTQCGVLPTTPRWRYLNCTVPPRQRESGDTPSTPPLLI